MGAVMQLANQRAADTKPLPQFTVNARREIDSFERDDLSPLTNQLLELKAEVLNLRGELARAQRAILQRDLLLENARVREMSLRAGMGA